MLSSIHPLGERSKHNRYAVTASAFVVGALLGGAATGVVLGAVGAALAAVVDPAPRLVAFGLVLVVAAVADHPRVAWRPPSWRRQVDENWLQSYRGWVYGGGFGLQLGAGVVTIISSASVYAALAAMVLVGSLAGGLAIGAAFGLTRGLVLLAGARVDAPDRLMSLHRRLQAGLVPSRLVSSTVLVAGAAVSFMVVIS